MVTFLLVPFYKRHLNLKQLFIGLEKQTCKNFEVNICAFEPDSELKEIVQKQSIPYRIIPVSGNEWNVSRSRNAGLKEFNHSKMRHLLLLDSDMNVEKDFIKKHQECSKENHVNIGYISSLITSIESNFISNGSETDARWRDFDPNSLRAKWLFGWTANMALTRSDNFEHIPYFDENFKGWGAEDVEWSYRLTLKGYEFRFVKECDGFHLPHERNLVINIAGEKKNLRYFLNKSKTYDVEVLNWLGGFEACRWLNQYGDILEKLGVRLWEIQTHNITSLFIGFSEHEIKKSFNNLNVLIKEYFLMGVCLPFENQSIDLIVISKMYAYLPQFALNRVLDEAQNVSLNVVYQEFDDLSLHLEVGNIPYQRNVDGDSQLLTKLSTSSSLVTKELSKVDENGAGKSHSASDVPLI